jgi:RNA polymerase sigma factor (sigma-70 family)
MKSAGYTALHPTDLRLDTDRRLGHLGPVTHLPDMTDILARDLTEIETMVRSAAMGDEAAFAKLVAEHHLSMSRVAFVVCGDADTTRDAVQSAWAIAWRRMRSLRKTSQVRAWLVAIAANEARQAIRRHRRMTVVDISEAIDRTGAGDPIESLAVVDLELALRGLKPEDRTLLAMRYAAGLDSQEIGEQLGITASGVRSRLGRLLERLRVDLAIPTETER